VELILQDSEECRELRERSEAGNPDLSHGDIGERNQALWAALSLPPFRRIAVKLYTLVARIPGRGIP